MRRAIVVLWLLVSLLACGEESREATTDVEVRGDAKHGQELVKELECVRCHSQGLFKTQNNCAVCHKAIGYAANGGPLSYVDGPPSEVEGRVDDWNRNIVHFRNMPSFVGVTRLLRSDWLAEFMQSPHDLRPRLEETMPHLPMSAKDATDVVAYLAKLDDIVEEEKPYFADAAIADWSKPHPPLSAGTVAEGRALFESMQCGSCHVFSGVMARSLVPAARHMERGTALAPDLRFTRDRFRKMSLVPWLLEPKFFKHDAAMPQTKMTYQQARDLAAFVMEAPLGPPAEVVIPERLPVLTRPVHHAEVDKLVFGKICVHCHADPGAELGDGGPGYAGGFGFAARKLDLSDYESIFAGSIDHGRRRSIFTKTSGPAGAGRMPLIVAALWARWEETAGRRGAVRGMPLALPPLSAEQIQLVESWIAQGRPR